MIEFYDYDTGVSVNYGIQGDPGIHTGLKDAILEQVNKKIGFFVHTAVTAEGSNAVFTIVGIRFGRVMMMDMQGSAHSGKVIVIQPEPYYGSDILTSPNAPTTNRLVGSTKLVR